MPTYGVTSQGWVAKPASVVTSEIDTALQGIVGKSAATEPDQTIPVKSYAGQIKVFLVDLLSAMWDLGQAIYAAANPNDATGTSLDVVCSITGTEREEQAFSTVSAACTGTPGTILQPKRVATVAVTGSRFDSKDGPGVGGSSTIAAVPAWTSGTDYNLGDRVYNLDGITDRVYQVKTAGHSAGSGGPTGTGNDITDNTVHWFYLGDGTGAVDVPFEAEQPGPIGASSGELNTIATPVSGWSNVYNPLDASVGNLTEIDSDLRAKRDAEVAADGNATADAIRAAVLLVNQGSQDPNHQPPVSCTVFHNETDATNGDGLPPHSVEVLVLGGTDQDIAEAIFRSVAAGTATYSSTGHNNTVLDSQGVAQTVYWTRPTAVPIYISPTVFYDPTKWPASGAAALVQQAVISAILTFANAKYGAGISVRSSYLIAPVIEGPSQLDSSGNFVAPAAAGSPPAPGIVEVNPMNIGTAPAPVTTTTITIAKRQIATFDSSRIVVTATPEAP